VKTVKNARTQEGFILATVLVFLMVLSLGAFFSARLTRSDIQIVTNFLIISGYFCLLIAI
jgi:Tfp pilus assembly protein PilX